MEEEKLQKIFAILAMPVMLLAVEIGSLLLTAPMKASGYEVFEDPSSVTNPVWFIAMLLGFTLILLILLKLQMKRVIYLIIQISLFLAFIYVFSGLAALITSQEIGILIGIICAFLAIILLWRYPEWYIVDLLGVLLAAGIASMFGISLEPIPVIMLLIILAIYDAISVYRTKHMLTLAEGVVDSRLPIMVVVPKKKGYSFIRDGIGGKIRKDAEETHETVPPETQERAAWLMGLGDLIMPAILVTSAAVFLPSPMGIVNLPAIGAIIGSLAGLAVLLRMVSGGNPQAGLPPLNGGVIIGFLIGWGLSLL